MEKTADESSASGLTPRVNCYFFSEGAWQEEVVSVPGEMPLSIFINGQEIATILCTPTKLTHLVLGFLYSEGIIDDISQVASLRVCEDEPVADVKLNADYSAPPRRTLTSGCGSGVSFGAKAPKVSSELVATPQEILGLMKQLYQQQELFQLGGGIHSSALCDRREILVLAEDIGRHNTLDKIMGECLMRRLSTQDRILVTTGRISSEMLLKAARMQTPIVVSRGAPTERAIALGRELGITVIGYARSNRLSAFCGEERLLAAVPKI
ncbi:MAG TPA: formate dehydrogenase accessory sulfurtransferase FdhD [Dehalococcoidia bacterium]|jgi:FdhD protein|nr:formate dehydrogenase accessory sulfurtransferase FdhD [Dehalococcoidia bacterium]